MLRFAGGVFLDATFRAPWCVLSQVEPEDCGPHQPTPPQIVGYHYVTEGELFLQVVDGPPQHVRTGPRTRILCGYLGTDAPAGPLLDACRRC